VHTHQIPRRSTWLEAIFRFCLLSVGLVVVDACSGPTAPTPAATSLSAGRWSGTTSQGKALTFTVSKEEMLTEISIGYQVNGCSGVQTFADLNVRTAPEVICVGPCPAGVSSFRQFAYSSGSPGRGPTTAVNGLFLPGNRAEGRASFLEYQDCGTESAVTWTATRR
jgi:hypothetical protein